MKLIYIPSSCPKCENQVLIERFKDNTASAYCMHCDFILPIDKNEFAYVQEYLTID